MVLDSKFNKFSFGDRNEGVMGIIFEAHAFWFFSSYFCSKCPNFIFNVLNFEKNRVISNSQFKQAKEYID
jgi:hypothetical protein